VKEETGERGGSAGWRAVGTRRHVALREAAKVGDGGVEMRRPRELSTSVGPSWAGCTGTAQEFD
jgi:hypothetical protein